MIKNSLRTNDQLTDLLGLGGIFIICFLYAVFGPYFAEWHTQYPFLNFPIFVGEFLTAYAALVFVLKCTRVKPKMTRWHDLLIIYISWVLIKAFSGYFVHGPLAFRNAALFYYPVFFVFGYTFFNKRIFTQNVILFLIAVIALVLSLKWLYSYYWFVSMNGFYSYFWFISLLVLIALLLKIRSKIIRIIYFLAIPFIYNLSFLFTESRSHLLAVILVCLHYIFYFAFFKPKFGLKAKWGVACFLIVILSIGVGQFTSRNALHSLLVPQELVRIVEEGNYYIKMKEEDFEYILVPTRLYSRNLSDKEIAQMKEETRAWRMAEFSWRMRMVQGIIDRYLEAGRKLSKEDKRKLESLGIELDRFSYVIDNNKDFSIKDLYHKPSSREDPEEEASSLAISYGNMAFRLFVWKDMFEELIETKPVFGISFGKPQRSKSIEMLRWAIFSWMRDGWVTPHNSFFHFIYRGGIVGLGIIIALFSVLFFIIKQFYLKRVTVGVILSGALIYWIMLANFLVILELPYHAIPFWTLLGILFAYSKEKNYAEE